MTGSASDFWIPGLSPVDMAVNGRWEPMEGTTWPYGPNDNSPADDPFWIMDQFAVRRSDIEDFLGRISPALTALLLAGYRVPFVDIVFPDPMTPSPFHQSPFYGEVDDLGMKKYWLRLDMTQRRIAMIDRDTGQDGHGEPPFGVQLKLDPVTVGGTESTLVLTTQSLEDRVLDSDAPLISTSDFYSAVFGAAPRHVEVDPDTPSATPLLSGTRGLVLAPLAAAMENASSWVYLPCPTYPTLNAVDPQGVNEPVNARLCLDILKSIVFDSITWWVGSEVIGAIEDWQQMPDPPAGSLPARAPGFTWVFDPGNWEGMFYIPDSSDTWNPMLLLEQVCGQIWEMFTWDGTEAWDANRHINGALDLLAFDPDLSTLAATWESPPAALGSSAARYMICNWLLSPELTSEPFHAPPLKFLDILNEEPMELHDDQSNDNPWTRSKVRWLREWHFTKSIRQLMRSAHGETLSARQQREVAQALREAPYPDAIFALFNLGILSMDGQVDVPGEGIVNAQIIPYRVPGHTNQITLRHSFSEDSAIVLTQKRPSGQPLLQSVAWEYVPAPTDLTPEDLALLEKVNPGITAHVAQARDRLVIVAAPGIEIDEVVAFPYQCKLEIYRVQSASLVPPAGSPINTQILQTPYSISIFDDVDEWDSDGTTSEPIFDPASPVTRLPPSQMPDDSTNRGTGSGPGGQPTLTDFRESARGEPDRVPFVMVKPWRTDDYSGVEISYNAPSTDLYRGIKGQAKIRISMANTSGDDRFAFDLRYKIHWRDHVYISTYAEMGSYNTVHWRHVYDDLTVIQFGLTVHATQNVSIKINDWEIGGPLWETFRDILGWSEAETSLLYSFWRGPFAGVADQGVPLKRIATAEDPANPATMSVPDPAGGAAHDFVENLAPPLYAEQDATIGEAKFLFDMAIGFVPLVGDLTDVTELAMSFVTGRDRWGKPITNFDRLLIAGGALLPVVSPRILRALKGTTAVTSTHPDPEFLKDFLDLRSGTP